MFNQRLSLFGIFFKWNLFFLAFLLICSFFVWSLFFFQIFLLGNSYDWIPINFSRVTLIFVAHLIMRKNFNHLIIGDRVLQNLFFWFIVWFFCILFLVLFFYLLFFLSDYALFFFLTAFSRYFLLTINLTNNIFFAFDLGFLHLLRSIFLIYRLNYRS